MKYRVTWEIEIEADSPVAAALEAEETLHDGNTNALVYSDTYRVVTEVDCRTSSVVSEHGSRKEPDW